MSADLNAWIICSCTVAVACVLGSVTADARGKPGVASRLRGGASAAYAVIGLFDAMDREWTEMGVQLALAAIWFWLWRHGRRKKGKRSLRQLGHKARARLAVMAGNMPRVPSRLVPQGAGA